MNNFQLILFFTGPGASYGWSEVYYLQQASIDTAATVALDVLAARLACLSVDCQFAFGKVSDVSVLRDSQAIEIAFSPDGTYGTTDSTMPPDTAALVTLFASSTVKNHKFWHGLQDTDFVNGQWTPTSAFLTAFAAWNTSTSGVLFCRHRLTPPPAATYEYVLNISSVLSFQTRNRKVGRPFGSPRGRRLA